MGACLSGESEPPKQRSAKYAGGGGGRSSGRSGSATGGGQQTAGGGGGQTTGGGSGYTTGYRAPKPDTAQDKDARAMAADRAAARQHKFETSAVGKAAYKGVADAKKPTGNVGHHGGISASDWQN